MQLQNIDNQYYNRIIKEIVTEDFRSASVFEKYGIDFCCKGNRPLSEAIKEKGLNRQSVMEELDAVLGEGENLDEAENMGLTELSAHIVNTHHAYVRRMLPVINAHLDKLSEVHGRKHPYILEIREIFTELTQELMSHIIKEEKILFPIVKYLVETKRFNERPKTRGYNTIKNPIDSMEKEHDGAGDALYRIRELTSEYNPPADACTTFRTTWKELEEFEKDLHRHVHLENNILFPRAIRLEEELLGKK